MNDMNFIPNWYIGQKKNLVLKKAILGVVFIGIINILLVAFYLINISKINNMNMEINNLSAVNLNSSKKNEQIRNLDTLKSFEAFNKDIKDRIQYKEINIKGNEISLELKVANKYEYIEFVKYIESIKKYSIKSLSILEAEGDFLKYKIVLGVKL